MENDETVYHNQDGTVFELPFDPETMTLVEHYHADDGTIIDNVVIVTKLASPPM